VCVTLEASDTRTLGRVGASQRRRGGGRGTLGATAQRRHRLDMMSTGGGGGEGLQKQLSAFTVILLLHWTGRIPHPPKTDECIY
jgi:hypothetical protein